jgi:hypothetical protein
VSPNEITFHASCLHDLQTLIFSHLNSFLLSPVFPFKYPIHTPRSNISLSIKHKDAWSNGSRYSHHKATAQRSGTVERFTRGCLVRYQHGVMREVYVRVVPRPIFFFCFLFASLGLGVGDGWEEGWGSEHR